MTTPRDVPPAVLERAAQLAQLPAPDLAELLRSNLETNLNNPDEFEAARDAEETEIEPLADLGFPVVLPDLDDTGTTLERTPSTRSP